MAGSRPSPTPLAKADWSSKWLTKTQPRRLTPLLLPQPTLQRRLLLSKTLRRPPRVVVLRVAAVVVARVAAVAAVPVAAVATIAVAETVVGVTTSAVAVAATMAAKS